MRKPALRANEPPAEGLGKRSRQAISAEKGSESLRETLSLEK